MNRAWDLARVVMVLVLLNWIGWILLSTFWGGTALGGEIAHGEYLIRRQPNGPGVSVSPVFWFFTLCYSTITFGTSFLIVSLAIYFDDPAYARGWIHYGAVVASVLWLAIIIIAAVPR